jgi:Tol biopolymer transport system component
LLNQVRTWIVLAALFLLCALALLPFAVAHLRHAPPTAAAGGRFTIAAPEKVSALRAPEISPDGRHLVFGAITEGKTNLWLRALGSLTAQPLPGATDVAGVHFWSPDSRSICFAADGKLKRFDLAGGRPQTLYDLPDGTLAGTGGGTWNRDGIILFTAGGVIYCVPAVGGVPTPVLESAQPQQEGVYRWPSFLPDGRHFLCLRIRTQPTASEIYLASLDSPATTRLTAANSQALYAASPTGSGYLLFARGDELLAASFDASSLKLTGQPFVVAEQVRSNSTDRGSFSVSSNGILVYDPTSARDQQQLGWVTRAGEPIETIGSPGAFQFPKLSPDGKHLAVARRSPQAGTNDIYVIELARGVSSRLTLDPADDTAPTWSPDGRRIVWASNRGGVYQLYQKLASGVGPEELLFKSDVNVFSSSWSADGRFILYIRPDPKTNNDLWLLPLAGARQPALFLQTPFSESGGRFSPDGRWIAYQSNDQRRPEVYVQPFPATGDKWQVSTQGGQFPHWRGDGKELFYLSLDGKLMAVAVKSGRSFAVELPQPLFVLAPLRALGNASYAVTADGRRFLFVSQAEETGNLQYTVVVNWAAEVKK